MYGVLSYMTEIIFIVTVQILDLLKVLGKNPPIVA